MKNWKFLAVAACFAAGLFSTKAGAAPTQTAPRKSESVFSKDSDIRITPIFHASVQIEYHGYVILVDPISAGTYKKRPDLILITHTHPDHLDTAAIANIVKPHPSAQFDDPKPIPVVIAPAAAVSALKSISGIKVVPLANWQLTPFPAKRKFSAGGELTTVLAVPAYNIVRGPKPGQYFHPKGQFNGYVFTLGNKRIYIAGDTEATPEMKKLKNIDIAFLPMNLPYTMTPQEAASAARAFKPKIVYPYHFRYPFDRPNNNPQQFAAALKGSGIQVHKIEEEGQTVVKYAAGVKGTGIKVHFLDFYPAAAVKKAVAAMGAKK